MKIQLICAPPERLETGTPNDGLEAVRAGERLAVRGNSDRAPAALSGWLVSAASRFGFAWAAEGGECLGAQLPGGCCRSEIEPPGGETPSRRLNTGCEGTG